MLAEIHEIQARFQKLTECLTSVVLSLTASLAASARVPTDASLSLATSAAVISLCAKNRTVVTRTYSCWPPWKHQQWWIERCR